ncbi:hypothetical protein [Hydrogenimonas thermophila]|uniref:Uncharacterized protein n=1 Tax=Hydrogenimonas thermophila TaxID=223786 RepID=A0A1I5U0S5_9BACT|nr:hypothetical protein [Hydrogenimonas thermophila]SFP88781.1 hypothetical protein SAMN05216234_15210 [Hydrogenimonas thermophila]
MDIFEDLNIEEEKLHPKYKLVRDNLKFTGEQEILKDWIEGFEDRDNKIVKEFQTTFHSAFWEFYLFAIFKKLNFEIDFSKDRPDFIIESPNKLYIEAVVSNIKQKGKQEIERTLGDTLSMLEPPFLQKNFYKELDESIVRHSNAILSKSKKYLNEYSKLNYIDNTTPYIIALSAYDQINYGNQYIYPIMALLYGAYYDVETDSYIKKEFILKPDSQAEIPIGLFRNNEMEHISAIIFSATVTLGKLTSLSLSQNKSPLKTNFVITIRHDIDKPHWQLQVIDEDNPEELVDGLFIFHNPFAKNKLDMSVFKNKGIMQITADEKGYVFKNDRLPLFSRLNNFLRNNLIINSLAFKAFNTFNIKDYYRVSFYEILEIDLEIEPKEMTILDVDNDSLYFNLPYIVDLEEKDISLIQRFNLKEKDIIVAIIYAKLDNQGNTSQWFIHSIL